MQPIETLPDVLRHVVLTYSPVIDRTRRAIGTRLMAISTTGTGHSVSEVIQSLSGLLPAKTKFAILAPFGLKYDAELLNIELPRSMVVEVPAMALLDPVFSPMIPELAARGLRLAIRGRSETSLGPELLPLFEYAVIAAAEERRKDIQANDTQRSLRYILTGCESVEQVDAAFARGCSATIGWPLAEPIKPSEKGLQASQAAVIKMLALVNQYADVAEIEQAMKVDPAIAFKLLKFINSPVFGATQQITSFSHAIMMLGYKKMLRWLALLMSSTSNDINNLPVMHASVRRGLFMEQLAAGDSDKRDALFIVGAFSLLDKITNQPLSEIFKAISVANDIQDAVMSRTGPYADALLLIEAIEKGLPSKIFALQSRVGISSIECNSALLHALRAAEEFDFGL